MRCAKVVFTGNFMAVNAYIKKEEKFQANNLTFHHKTLDKEEKLNLK